MHRTHITTDMVKFSVWTFTLILCAQTLISLAEGAVETSMIDPFDGGRTDAVGQESKEWIDPFDMTHYSHAENRMVKDSCSIKVFRNCKCGKNAMENLFLQRLVNLLINQCQNGEETLLFKVTSNQLKDLYRLKKAADSEATVRVLNGIFSYMTVHNKPSIIPSFIMDIIISEEVWSNVAAMSFAVIPFCVLIMGGTTRRIMLILALSAFAVSYYKTQKFMLQKLEVENEHTFMKQTECSSRGGSWFSSLFRPSNDAECLKLLQAQKIDPSLEVTPIKVIAHMISVGLFQPLEHFGTVFSRFSNHIFDTHSWLKGIFVFMIAAFIVIYIITACLAGIFGRDFSVGTRLISLGITGSAEPHIERRQASIEPAAESQVAPKSNAVINHGQSLQPVIQIIHNYPSKHVDVPIVTNDNQKQVVSVKDISNTTEMKLAVSSEETHKIHVITPDTSSTKDDTTKICEPEDKEK